jgi:PAS domain S-box-containing protein
LIITSFEITDRKRAEEELQRSEELYRTVVSNVPDSVVTIYDEELRCITIDGPLLHKLGVRREDVIGRRFGEGAYARGDVDQQTYLGMKGDYAAVFRGESRTREAELAGRTFLTRSLPIRFGDKTVCMSISLDITERKRAEEALRASEERYRTLFETAPNAISVFDSHLRLQMTNERAAKLYGFDRANDLLDVDVLGFVAPEDRPRIKELFTRVQTTGSLEMFESSGIRKDGKPFQMETLATLLPNADNASPSILTVNTDITERKEAEKALKDSEEQLRALSAKIRSTREEEGTRIAREIHDELGGALTGLKWDLEGIDSRLAGDGNGSPPLPEVRKRINSMTGLIESTIKTVRRISSELRPGVLDDLGLVAAIEWQGQQFQSRTGLKFHFDTELDMAEVNREGATAVFRIFQEVLTNVLRHSQAQNIYVKLLDHDDVIELEVRDDGRGITERERRNTHSLGLLGMKERALLVGGNVTIRGAQGRGTTVTVRVPKNYEPT